MMNRTNQTIELGLTFHHELLENMEHFKNQLGYTNMPITDFFKIVILSTNLLLTNKDEVLIELIKEFVEAYYELKMN